MRSRRSALQPSVFSESAQNSENLSIWRWKIKQFKKCNLIKIIHFLRSNFCHFGFEWWEMFGRTCAICLRIPVAVGSHGVEPDKIWDRFPWMVFHWMFSSFRPFVCVGRKDFEELTEFWVANNSPAKWPNWLILFSLSPQNRKLIQIKFVLKEMDSLYLDELRSTISQLMLNLESLPVSSKGGDSKYGLQKLKRYNQRWVFKRSSQIPLLRPIYGLPSLLNVRTCRRAPSRTTLSRTLSRCGSLVVV